MMFSDSEWTGRCGGRFCSKYSTGCGNPEQHDAFCTKKDEETQTYAEIIHVGCLPTLSLLLVSSPKHTSMKPVYILLRDAVARVVILMPTFATWLCFVGSHAHTSGSSTNKHDAQEGTTSTHKHKSKEATAGGTSEQASKEGTAGTSKQADSTSGSQLAKEKHKTKKHKSHKKRE